MLATIKGGSAPYQQFLAVMAALALVLAAGLTAGAAVRSAARAVDEVALQHQRVVLDMNVSRLRGLDDAASLEAAGRALGLDALARLDRPRSDASLAGLAVKTAGGDAKGYFVWRPERPGARLLAAARPGFSVAGGLLLLFAFTALWLARTGIQHIAGERARAEYLAHSDQLTGLANRRVFNGRITELLASAAPGEGPCFALLAIDLDHFKALNDRFGHIAGDAALAEVARRLSALVPATTTLVRFGGDEFAVLAPDLGPEEALRLGTLMATAIAQPYIMQGGLTAHLGGSIGIACAPLHGTRDDDIIRRADIALYEVKEGGRSFALMFEPAMEARAAARALRGDGQPYLSTPGQRSSIAP